MHFIPGRIPIRGMRVMGTWQLATATAPEWASQHLPHLEELLLEQAHLEKKAAAAAMAFLFRYPGRPRLQRPLSRLAREELLHFERVIGLLERRGAGFGPQIPGPYAERLKAILRPREPDRLLDELLLCAVIEERSRERMGLLATATAGEDPDVGALYRELVAAEERHGLLYVELALASFPEPEVAGRWREITDHESRVLLLLPPAHRLHSP